MVEFGLRAVFYKLVVDADAGNVWLIVVVGHKFENSAAQTAGNYAVFDGENMLEMFSYFVQGIAAKWYSYVNKKEAGEYASACRRYLEEIKEKAFYKKKPVRPTYG